MDLALRRRAAAWRRSSQEVLGDLRREWSEDRVSGLAAEIAFFGALSIFPGLLVIASALGTLERIAGEDVATDVRTAILERLQDVFGSGSGLETAIVDLFEGASPGVLTFGVIGAIYSASRGFSAIIGALDIVYDHHVQRSWLARRLLSLVLSLGTLLIGALALALLVVGPLLGRGPEVADRLGFGAVFITLWDWGRVPLTFLVLAAWSATIYHVAPSHRSPWRWEVPGAVFSAFGWVAVSFGLRFYLDFADSGTNALLGTIGGALSLLLWLFALSIVFLVGGELNAILVRRHDVSTTLRAPPRSLRRHWSTFTGLVRRRRLR